MRSAAGERVVLGHSLVELSAAIGSLASFRDDFAVLDQYYIPTRYPDGLPGGAPYDVYTEKQASEAVDVAERLLELTRSEIG